VAGLGAQLAWTPPRCREFASSSFEDFVEANWHAAFAYAKQRRDCGCPCSALAVFYACAFAARDFPGDFAPGVLMYRFGELGPSQHDVTPAQYALRSLLAADMAASEEWKCIYRVMQSDTSVRIRMSGLVTADCHSLACGRRFVRLASARSRDAGLAKHRNH
jgi:hypothetical protein